MSATLPRQAEPAEPDLIPESPTPGSATPESVARSAATAPGGALDPAIRVPLQRAMSQGAGVLRTASSLAGTAAGLLALGGREAPANTASWEAANLLTVASAVVAAAVRREETRGCHWREDFAEADDAWRGHLLAAIGSDDQVTQTWEPMDDR